MSKPRSNPTSESGPRHFATTHWSVVAAAGGRRDDAAAHQALSQLCETYWYPLYVYARRRVTDVADAQDLTQAFFAELLEKNAVSAATPERGRFRAFLLTAFQHFLSKQREKSRALKRGGGRTPLSLDFATADSAIGIEPATHLTPEQIFDQHWALAVLRQTLTRLESELAQAGKQNQFDELRGFIIGDHGETTYAQAAAKLNMTEAAAKKAASRLRQRYRDLLRAEIAQTVADPADVDDEIRNLFTVFQF